MNSSMITGTRARDIAALVTLYNMHLCGVEYIEDEFSTYTCVVNVDGEVYQTVCKVQGIGRPSATEISRTFVFEEPRDAEVTM